MASASKSEQLYQVDWFNKKTGYGFALDKNKKQLFVHFSDIQVPDGILKYLKAGEYIRATKTKRGDKKVILTNVRAPVDGLLLMCEVDKKNFESRRTYNNKKTNGKNNKKAEEDGAVQDEDDVEVEEDDCDADE